MRSGTKKVTFIAIVVIAAVIVVAVVLRGPTVTTYDFRTYESIWQSRVNGLLEGRQSAASSCWTLGGSGAILPGFGSVNSYCWTSVPGHQLNFRFISISTSGEQQLLYMPEANDWKLQHGYCVIRLSGPWWQLASSSNACPRGFTRVA